MVTPNAHIRFHNFWPGFNPEEFFLPLLKGLELFKGSDIKDLGFDVEFYTTPQPRSMPRRVAQKIGRMIEERFNNRTSRRPVFRVWFTPENCRPPTNEFHATLSFDGSESSFNNFRLPLWWLLFPNLVGGPETGQDYPRLGGRLSLQEATSGRAIDRTHREKFACGFFGKMWFPRAEMAQALSHVGKVDLYGPALGHPVGPKLEVARGYRYVLCPENDLYPGYITEKALEAWAAGSIPIYWGDDKYSDLNPHAVVNLAKMESLEQLVSEIRLLEAEPKKVADMRAMPILREAPDITGLQVFLSERLKAFVTEA